MSPNYLLSSIQQYRHPFLPSEYPKMNLIPCVTLHGKVHNAESLPDIKSTKSRSLYLMGGKEALHTDTFFCILSE